MLDRNSTDLSVINDPSAEERIARDPDDWYPTPAYCPLALLEHETFEGDIWDPCCGDGEMIIALKTRLANSNRFIASDLNFHGYGIGGRDFLKVDVTTPVVDNIITNFPFGLIDPMMKHALAASRRKVASFARLGLLCGGKRRAFLVEHPPQRILIFCERVTMFSRRTQVKHRLAGKKETSGILDCAWYIWDKNSDDHMRVSLIKPGRKHEYGDVTRTIRNHLIERAIARFAA
ncbi:MAG TPA: hypothetical protein P5256_00275 [Beijerinckiaceae bacterium]|nr:hypothetical protein [Rhodoblastus sp.]MCC2108479.1 hypothetical protein [Hyphomicrobiales bacterium]MCO5088721.1 hypothetical protein [Methylobacteriaceae bacterium]HRY01531.1 hypothetical protein [Beijerinckiaceae bacterium]MCB1533316.1 hypothetical protein [Rhodoblastus sp.]